MHIHDNNEINKLVTLEIRLCHMSLRQFFIEIQCFKDEHKNGVVHSRVHRRTVRASCTCARRVRATC